MWRAGLLETPTDCSQEGKKGGQEQTDSCAFSCFAEATDDAAWARRFFENRPFAMKSFHNDDDKLMTLFPNLETRRALVVTVCESRWRWGDQSGAESPLDPSFWPMHPTLDRLYQYKRLLEPAMNLTFFDDDDDRRFAVSTKKTKRRWTTCKYEGFLDCDGHREQDATLFEATVFSDEDGSYGSEVLSNIDVLKAADPNDYRFDYIYDSFAWDHCAATDAPFADAPRQRNNNTRL